MFAPIIIFIVERKSHLSFHFVTICYHCIAYELSKVENHIGGPEEPLSDLGLLSYRRYWTYHLFQFLMRYKVANKSVSLTIAQISEKTFIHTSNIISTFQFYKMFAGQNELCFNEEHEKIFRSMKEPKIKFVPKSLKWIPPDRLK